MSQSIDGRHLQIASPWPHTLADLDAEEFTGREGVPHQFWRDTRECFRFNIQQSFMLRINSTWKLGFVGPSANVEFTFPKETMHQDTFVRALLHPRGWPPRCSVSPSRQLPTRSISFCPRGLHAAMHAVRASRDLVLGALTNIGAVPSECTRCVRHAICCAGWIGWNTDERINRRDLFRSCATSHSVLGSILSPVSANVITRVALSSGRSIGQSKGGELLPSKLLPVKRAMSDPPDREPTAQ